MASELEQKIASLRAERVTKTGLAAKETDRKIATLVRVWRATGGRLEDVAQHEG